MSRFLGSFLVDERILTPAQLSEALESQQIYGGRLGTNLLELGHLGLDTLAGALGLFYQLPVAEPADFEGAPHACLQLVPAHLAEAAECFPLREEGRKLHVAFANPGDLTAIDRVAFSTGRIVVPYVAPELRIRFYLERRYGVPRPPRHAWLTKVFRKASASPTGGGAPARPRVRSLRADGRVVLGAQGPEPSEAAVADPDDVILLDDEEAPQSAAPGLPDPVPYEEALVRLGAAVAREEVGQILIGYLAALGDAGVLLQVAEGRAIGWKGFSASPAPDPIEGLVVPFSPPNLFERCAREGKAQLGPLPAHPVHRQFIAYLGGVSPAEALLEPIAIGRRVVQILYADRGPEGRFDVGSVRATAEVARAAARAYERIILARRAAGL